MNVFYWSYGSLYVVADNYGSIGSTQIGPYPSQVVDYYIKDLIKAGFREVSRDTAMAANWPC